MIPVSLVFPIVTIVHLLLMPSIVPGQVVKECEMDLARDIVQKTLDMKDSYSLAHVLTEQQFNMVKQGLSAGVTAVIGDIPITPELSWESFRAKRQEKFEHIRVNLDSAKRQDYFTSTVSRYGLDGYKTCIGSKTLGLTLLGESVESDVVVVRAYFNVATGDQTERRLALKEGGKTIDSEQFVGSLGDQNGTSFVVPRDPSKTLTVTAEVIAGKNKIRKVLSIPKEPKVQQLRAVFVGTKVGKVFANRNAGVKYETNSPLVLSPDPGTYFDTSRIAQFPSQVGTNVWKQITSADKHQIRLEAGAGEDPGGRSTAVALEVKVPMMKDVWDDVVN